jgi:multidrug transporter EmrE-like cation transporter
MMINGFSMVLLAIVCNVVAQCSLKMASSLLINGKNVWNLNFNGSLYLLFGALFYVMTFILALKIYKNNELSVIAPVMMGLIFVFTFLSSILIFKEHVTARKIAGAIIVILGAAILSSR